MMIPRVLTLTVCLWLFSMLAVAQTAPPAVETPNAPPRAGVLFGKQNLVAWCIVPFDATNRNPAERVAMLQRLGICRVAYDWRKEHVPTFEEEITQYKKHKIDFFAFWDWHEAIEPLIKKHGVKPQIWKTAPSPEGETRDARVQAAAKVLLPLVEKTNQLGLKLGLYNHGGWGGEPENLVAVCEHLRQQHHATHVGIVYNLHHAHGQLDGFAKNLKRMRPYLLCLNINGMVRASSLAKDPSLKIVPVGAGEVDGLLIRAIIASGFAGPIGVLDHRNELDAEQSLRQNLGGLQKIVTELEGSLPD